ncbi:MAG: FecR family protein [Treponema sp.]|nr:FecR family protein [Treponema sp.]
MKKIFIFVLFYMFVLNCVFSQAGIIRELTGEVELKRAGSTAFVRASAGDTVSANTIISTGFRSTAVIAVGSALITVRPLTRLTLAEIQSAENTENINVNLQAGRVRVDVNPPAGTRTNMSVQSPSATASVRGTSFEMDIDNVSVTEGRVVFNGTAGPPVMVTAGNESMVTANGTPANPPEVAVSSLTPASPVGAPSPETVTQAPESVSEGVIVLDMFYE